MLLVVVDALSKWPEVKVVKYTITADTLKKLNRLFTVGGSSQESVTDNGSQFTADEFSIYFVKQGIQHIRTAPGHLPSNGQVERYVDTVITAITKGISDGRTFETALSNFPAKYRTTVRGATGKPPRDLLPNRQKL